MPSPAMERSIRMTESALEAIEKHPGEREPLTEGWVALGAARFRAR